MTGVFVTGTGTDVGKTMVSAWLVRSWQADYWKPVQSGTCDTWDADAIRRVVPEATIHPSTVALKAPLSPHQAAEQEGVVIRTSQFRLPVTARPLVVVVARSGLGTINHTLMTLEALDRRAIPVAGVILNGPPHPDNRAAIERFGAERVLAELPHLPSAEALHDHPPVEWHT